MLFRPQGMTSGIPGQLLSPGDILGSGEQIGSLTTAGAGTWTAALIAGGIIRRTGPGGGYTDTTDTSTNILAALSGNQNFPEIVPGTTWRMIFQNTVAQAMTFAAGAGVVAGLGTLNCAASLVREYLWKVLAVGPTATVQAATTNGSPNITFVFPPGKTAYQLGSDPSALNLVPGMSVSGTGIAAGATILGLTQGVGGITGAVLSANCTATSAATGEAITFRPTLEVNGLYTGTL